MRLLALATLLLSCAPARAPERTGPLAPVAWIAGSWRGESAEGVVEELWSTPSGGMMLGTGRIVRDGKLVLFEFLRIEARANAIVYVAQPRGGPPTEFTMTNATASAATFENPAHDFPRRIVYTRAADGSLVIHIDGVENGAPLSQNVTLRRP